MDFVAPVGSSDPTSWVNGDRATGVKGSRVPHQAFTDSNAEVVNAIIAGGEVPDPNDLTQLSRVMFPGPADPPRAPNLPHTVYGIDGSQLIAHAVNTPIQWQVEKKNNLVDSTFDGTTLTVGAQDAGLYLLTFGILWFPQGAYGLSLYLYVNGVQIVNTGQTSTALVHLSRQLSLGVRLQQGDVVTFNSQSNLNFLTFSPDVGTAHLSIIKLSV